MSRCCRRRHLPRGDVHPLKLQIQRLGGYNEQVLILLHVLQLRGGHEGAAPSEVAELFREFHLPPPTNERQHLIQLRKRRLVMQPDSGRWAVTPEGREEISRLLADVSGEELQRLGEEAGEPIFAGAAHHRIPASLAPAQFQQGIFEFLRDHPSDRNVFLMMRYPQREDSYRLEPTVDVCRSVLVELNLEPHLASDRAVHDQVFPNVGVYLWSCNFGVAVLENRENKGLNYNVVLETGAMLMTGRRCLLLKDKTANFVPTDLVAHIHKAIDLDEPETLQSAIREWVTSDLHLA